MLNFNLGPANRGGGNGNQNPHQAATPLERIRATVSTRGIVAVGVPFQTPRAQAVRQFMHARLLNKDNQKMFIWRAQTNNLWTNIHLNSTPEAPLLTAPPVECATSLTTILTQCPDVSEVNLYDEQNNLLSLDDVRGMEFDDLTTPSRTEPDMPLPPLPTPSNEAVVERLRQMENKVDVVGIDIKKAVVQFQADVEQKLGYIIDKLNGNTRLVYDMGTTPSTQKPGEPGSSSSAQVGDADKSDATPVRASSRAGGKRKAN